MAVRNITQFDEAIALEAADWIHLGRESEPDPSLQDKKISGVNFFNSLSPLSGLFGAPNAPTPITTSETDVKGYGTALGSSDGAAGTITAGVLGGISRVTMMLDLDTQVSNADTTLTILLSVNGGAGITIDRRTSRDEMVLSGSTLMNLAGGSVLTMRVVSSVSRTPIYLNASFDLEPLFVV